MPTGTQLLAQLAPQRPTRLDEQRQIDRLVRDPHRRIILVGPAQPLRNLLRRPPTLKLLLHDPAQPRVERELRQLRTTRTLPRRPLSTLRAVAPATAVAVDLPRDRRVRTTNRPPDRPKALTARQPARNLRAPPTTNTARRACADTVARPQTQQHTRSRGPLPSQPRARSRATSTPQPTTPTPALAATPATDPSPPPFARPAANQAHRTLRRCTNPVRPPREAAVSQPLPLEASSSSVRRGRPTGAGAVL